MLAGVQLFSKAPAAVAVCGERQYDSLTPVSVVYSLSVSSVLVMGFERSSFLPQQRSSFETGGTYGGEKSLTLAADFPSRRRYCSAEAVASRTMDESMIMRPYPGSPGGMQSDRNSTPNRGVKAYRIFQQNVAATAFAASKGIQYPSKVVRLVLFKKIRLC